MVIFNPQAAIVFIICVHLNSTSLKVLQYSYFYLQQTIYTYKHVQVLRKCHVQILCALTVSSTVL